MRARIAGDSGGRGPALLYVPGIDGTGEFLLGTAGRLARHFRLVRFRYEGAGRDASYGSLAADIASEVEGLGMDRVLVLAESFGVALALQFALDRPRLVRGMALVNGFARFDAPNRLRAARLVACLTPGPLFRLGRRWGAARTLFGPRRDPEALAAFHALPGNPFDAGYRRRLAMIQRVNLEPRLGELRMPLALFAADQDRVVAAVDSARRMQSLAPDTTLTIIPRAGHLILPLTEEPWPERLLELDRRARSAPDPPRTPPKGT